MAERVLPKPTPESQHYWDGAKQGELRLQACNSCEQHYFPPRPFCPKCGSRDVKVVKASGKGRLYSYIINHLPSPGFTPPFTVAIVELEEGPRLMTNLLEIDPDPEKLVLDMPLEVTFEKINDEITLPQFKPAKS
ncbi:MAG: Zn-ribbon domain-containing OB-fold protein [Alphaproteobacteria bacterium]|nr:Zn-ribbon domain-containing OB-fold protein [Alphaproteobacteria bacterium]